jgi:hypothetical protein
MKHFQLLVILILLSSCSTNRSIPDWLTNFEHDPRYFSALSVVDSRQADYQELARDYAAREISMQISTSIESEIKLTESEAYGISNNQYLSLIRSTTTARLKNLSPVQSFDDGQKYYVLYRLSKAEYYAERRLERDLAKSKADELLQKYDAGIADPALSIPLLISALDQIAEFLDMDLTFQDRDLGAAILSRIHQLPALIDYRWDAAEIQVVAKDSNPIPLSGKVRLSQPQIPVARIPLCFYSPSIDIQQSTFSDANGDFSLNLNRVDSFEALQFIELNLDQEYYDPQFQSSAALSIWHGVHFSPQRLLLRVSKPKIYLDYAYISGYQSGYRESVAGYLANLNLALAQKTEDAQYILQVRIFAKKGDYLREYGYYTAFADIHLSLMDPRSGATVNYLELGGLKSGGNSREQAERNTERDAVQEIGDTLLYQLLYDYLIK